MFAKFLRTMKIAVVLAVTALGLLMSASSALASHSRPQAASPMTFRLVPAFAPCTTGVATGEHGPPPLGSPSPDPSCSPPTERSPWLTAKTPDRPAPFTGLADATGRVTLKVTCVSSINPPVENGDTPPCIGSVGDQQDLVIEVISTGVYCQVGSPTQGFCAGGPGSAYSGKVLGTTMVRITDHYNSTTVSQPCNTAPIPGPPASPPPFCPGTALDFPFTVGAQCMVISGGGSCNYTTSADAIVTNVVLERKRAVWELSQLQIQDAGADGNLVSAPPPTTGVCPPACSQGADNTFGVAAAQGLFIP